MDLFKQDMMGPTRPAPNVPGMVSRYSPVTNWNDDPFGADLFEPTPFTQKKKPPPRPPPPNILKPSDNSNKPSHFVRKPTVLSAILSRKSKNNSTVNNSSVNKQSNLFPNINSEVDTSKIFHKCEKVNIQTGTLIDLSSPPSSPTFTTRSSSDGVSVDSFGSDATTSTNHHNAFGGGNASQAESGFEDDFDLFLSNRKPISKDDTLDDFSTVDPFSAPVLNKPSVIRKTAFSSESFETLSNASSQYSVPSLNGPTIIRAKPARPKPPDNLALLKSSFGNNFQVTSMNVNTTTPIQQVGSGSVNVDLNALSWQHEESPERESTPPMPTIPPPPPPVIDDDLPEVWPEDVPDLTDSAESETLEHNEPYGIALFDYFTNHQEDLCFSANSKITLIRRVNDEWMYGRLRSGAEGLFPSNYVEVKVPLPNERPTSSQATALYDFDPVQTGDLTFRARDKITVLSKINDEWYFGECNGRKGQFPANYVQIS